MEVLAVLSEESKALCTSTVAEGRGREVEAAVEVEVVMEELLMAETR